MVIWRVLFNHAELDIFALSQPAKEFSGWELRDRHRR
jgi:hypothetical protein